MMATVLRRITPTLALVALAACAKEKPAADTATAKPQQGLPAPETLKAAPVAAPDSAKMRSQADTKGASSKGEPATVPPKVPANNAKQGQIIGRDSVSTKPKVLGLPVVADTAKRRPPR